MTKQINVKFTENEQELHEWVAAQNSASGSMEILIRQAIARYGKTMDLSDALIRESINHNVIASHEMAEAEE